MLSAVIPSGRGYPAAAAGATTGTPEVRPLRSSRTKSRASQTSSACGR